MVYFSFFALAAMFLSFTGSLVPRHKNCVAAVLRGERELLGDPECISAGKNIKTKWVSSFGTIKSLMILF